MNIKLIGYGNIEVEPGMSAFDAIRITDKDKAKKACVAKINGKIADLRTIPAEGDEVEILDFYDEDGRKAFRHTASHIMAQAVKRLYPNAKLAIGPSIDSGFYYDFDVEESFTAADLTAIESEMKKIVKENLRLEHYELSPQEAIDFYKQNNEDYKIDRRTCRQRRKHQLLSSGRIQRAVRRSASDEHQPGKGFQTHSYGRCLLARRQRQAHALPYLRHCFPQQR